MVRPPHEVEVLDHPALVALSTTRALSTRGPSLGFGLHKPRQLQLQNSYSLQSAHKQLQTCTMQQHNFAAAALNFWQQFLANNNNNSNNINDNNNNTYFCRPIEDKRGRGGNDILSNVPIYAATGLLNKHFKSFTTTNSQTTYVASYLRRWQRGGGGLGIYAHNSKSLQNSPTSYLYTHTYTRARKHTLTRARAGTHTHTRARARACMHTNELGFDHSWTYCAGKLMEKRWVFSCDLKLDRD